jgi:hypothetical protein
MRVALLLVVVAAVLGGAQAELKGEFKIKEASNGQHYFVLRAPNHEIVLVSQMYSRRQDCIDGIEAVLATGSDRNNWKQRTASNGQPYFVLQSPNGKIIGVSELYEEKGGRANGIDACVTAVNSIADFIAKDATSNPQPGARVEIKNAQNGKVYFVLKAANHEVVLASQMYENKSNCLTGISSIIKNGGLSKNYERRVAQDHKPYFVIKAQNHEIIGVSETYEREHGRDVGVSAVQTAVRGFIQHHYLSKL